jgi:hypothetical protein
MTDISFVFFVQKQKDQRKEQQVDEKRREKLVENDVAQNFHGSTRISHRYLLQWQKGDN